MKIEKEGIEIYTFTYEEVYKLLLLAYYQGAKDLDELSFSSMTTEQIEKFIEPRLNKILSDSDAHEVSTERN